MNKIEFINAVNKKFKNPDPHFFDQIEKYKNIIQEYDQKISLSNLVSNEKIYGEYFYESIIPYANVDFKNDTKLLDIGSGSGIPGIVLKLLYPFISLTIIEATAKKANFMKLLVSELNLDNVTILNKRAEDIKSFEREQFDIVTSRAVAPLFAILELSTAYAKVGGLIIQPKSKNFNQELLEAKEIINKLDLQLINQDEFTSINNYFHHVFYFKKLKKTNELYPRSWSKIVRK